MTREALRRGKGCILIDSPLLSFQRLYRILLTLFVSSSRPINIVPLASLLFDCFSVALSVSGIGAPNFSFIFFTIF